MSQENVETIRRAYAAYNAAFGAPNPQEAIRASLERFSDPEIEFELDPIVSIDRPDLPRNRRRDGVHRGASSVL